MTPLRAIREHCLDCQGWDGNGRKPIKAVTECPEEKCRLYPFRLGRNPFHPMSKAKRVSDNLKPYKK